jgi:replicative DNA helicase
MALQVFQGGRAPLALPVGTPPPWSDEAEQAILAAILIDGGALDDVFDVLKAEHFYSEAHRRIFEAACGLHAVHAPIDTVQVMTHLKASGRLEQVGGPPYITGLLSAAPAVALERVLAYARTVFDLWRVRELLYRCEAARARVYAGEYGSAQLLLEGLETELFELARTPANGGTRDPGAVLTDVHESMRRAAQFGGRVEMPTGFAGVDRRTRGFVRQRLYVLGGRPGMGKTSFALNTAISVAQQPFGVLIFSLEVTDLELLQAAACTLAGVDTQRAEAGCMSEVEWRRFTDASNVLSRLPIRIDDRPGRTLGQIHATIRRTFREWARLGIRPGLVMVDHIGLVKPNEKQRGGNDNREQQVGEVSRTLKELAKQHNVAFLALAQLNRAVENRQGAERRPRLSDLRDSGQIEQDADSVWFLHRDDYYARGDGADTDGLADLVVAKQRQGRQNFTVKLRFDAPFRRFDNAPEWDRED